ncbi:MAG: patatin-like phospholipase family protein [Leptothrix sp. (in: b-proteobacteria)]
MLSLSTLTRSPKLPVWLRAASQPRLSLALQGGGAHGAYTWGVLDALLEADRYQFDAISGTSAGAMNAIVMAQGLMAGGPQGARAALTRFWLSVAGKVPFEWFSAGDEAEPSLSPAARVMLQWAQFLSPAQLNPLGLNPLRELLAEQVDFERLRRHSPVQLSIAATQANTGRLRLFGNAELSVDVALASACLPTLHHAVVIDGEPYWDGGYSANPALFPLTEAGRADDVLIVMLSPLVHGPTPVSANEIRTRAVEIAFTSPFLREAQLLGAACAEARQSLLRLGSLERRLARLRWHLIDAQDALGHLPTETKLIARKAFLERLCALGRARAQDWLARSGDAVGARASIDLEHLLA